MTDNALSWTTAGIGSEPPADYYCPTRDVADGRLPKLFALAVQNSLSENKASLLTALVAELTANCFDHNLGSWRDIFGCWLSFQYVNQSLAIVVADRGQGILQSLKHVDANLNSDHDALIVALTKQISGRYPEHRGRGLKFIMASLNQEFPRARFIIHTGETRFDAVFPLGNTDLASLLTNPKKTVLGTYAKLVIVNNVK